MHYPKMVAPQIIYEDSHILAVNKPAGMAIGAAPDYAGLIMDYWLENTLKRKVYYPIHRLDTPVSGIWVAAKHKAAAAALSKVWQSGCAEKIYWAVTERQPPEAVGHLCHYLRKDAAYNRTMAYDKALHHTCPSELAYRFVGSSNRYPLLAVRLISGRHHQIRAQLAAINCPIKGDVKYGAKRSNPAGGIYLHALRLSLPYPYLNDSAATQTEAKMLTLTALPPNADTDALWHFFAANYGSNAGDIEV